MSHEACSGWLQAPGGPVPVRIREPRARAAGAISPVETGAVDQTGAVGAVVIVPPIALDAAIAIRAVHALAIAAADAELLSYVFPLPGDGDAPPVADGVDLAATWVDAVRAVVAEARRRVPGRPVSVVGVRLGAAVALAAHELGTHTVLWESQSGSRYVTEQRLRRRMDTAVAPVTGDGVEIHGAWLTAAQVASIRRLRGAGADLPAGVVVPPPAERAQVSAWFERADFSALLPRAAVARLVADLPVGAAAPVEAGRHTASAVVATPTGRVRETFVDVGPHRLAGLLTEPIAAAPRPGGIVLTAQGPEQRCGPGGMWAHLARDLATDGVRSLRVDRRRQGDHTDPCDPGGFNWSSQRPDGKGVGDGEEALVDEGQRGAGGCASSVAGGPRVAAGDGLTGQAATLSGCPA